MFLMTLGAMRKLLILFTLTNGTHSYKRLMPNNIVQDHFISENKEPLLMMITGVGSSGKSFVIQALSQLLHTKCRVCAFFGITALNIKGKTSHSLLQLPIKGKKNGPLKSSALEKLQHDLEDVNYLIID